MKLSRFGEKYTRSSGIGELMDDLGNALLIDPNMKSLGGGNPARIPKAEFIFQAHLQEMLADKGNLHKLIGCYQSPQGEVALLKTLASWLKKCYGWPLTEKNIAITNGGQAAFYVLANMFAGLQPDGSMRKIQFPLTPEYLGYTDSGLEEPFFHSVRPEISILGKHLFKYRVDFNRLKIDSSIAALCVSRPTNPTGNVLTDEEVSRLDELAREHDIPFIIDCAYGEPFPGIVFSDIEPFWNSNTILMMSLSKLGLPGLRSGFLVANEEVIKAFSSANAILNLASGNIGPYLIQRLLVDNELSSLINDSIKPFYLAKMERAMSLLSEAMNDDLPYYIHKPEGAIFLWLWFKDLPIDSATLYQRLKSKGVLIVPGNNSFPGLDEADQHWRHTQECIRISYAQDDEQVQQGIKIIAEEVNALYSC